MAGVFDIHKEQTGGRGARPGFSRKGGIEETQQILAREIAFAHFGEHPDNVANHMLQESCAPDAVKEKGAAAFDHGREDAADFGPPEGVGLVGGGESREVVFAFKQQGCFRHASFVERIRMMVHVAALEGRADLFAENAVFVSLRNGVMTGMKTLVNLLGGEYADLPWQQAVHSAAEIFQWNGVFQGECSHLAQGVHACVGSSGPNDRNRGALDFRQNLLQHSLDGRQPRLNLPTMEVRPIVSERDLDAAHAGRRAASISLLAPLKMHTIPLDFQGTMTPLPLVFRREGSEVTLLE